jgi:predicted Zn-dependent peptidase
MVWHMLADLAYKHHPYRWPTIGKTIEHIAEADLEHVQHFYKNFYGPNNAILSIAGPEEPSKVLDMVRLRFGSIPARPIERLPRAEEPGQTETRVLEDEGKYPSSVLYLAWLMDSRNGSDYYAFDLLSDVMSLGRSALFYQRMVKVLQLCAHIDTYITGTEDRGLFIIEARPAKGVSMEDMETQLWSEIEGMQTKGIEPSILEKLKNKNESTVCFSNISASHKATNLAYYESLGDAELINTEAVRIGEVTTSDISRVVNALRKNNVNILRLTGKEGEYATTGPEDQEDEDELFD